MRTQDGIATAGRCFLFGFLITSLATPQRFAQGLDNPRMLQSPCIAQAMHGHVLEQGELVGVFQAPQ